MVKELTPTAALIIGRWSSPVIGIWVPSCIRLCLGDSGGFFSEFLSSGFSLLEFSQDSGFRLGREEASAQFRQESCWQASQFSVCKRLSASRVLERRSGLEPDIHRWAWQLRGLLSAAAGPKYRRLLAQLAIFCPCILRVWFREITGWTGSWRGLGGVNRGDAGERWVAWEGESWLFEMPMKSLWLPLLFPRRWRGLLRYRLFPPVDIFGLPDMGDELGAFASTLAIPSDFSRSGLENNKYRIILWK